MEDDKKTLTFSFYKGISLVTLTTFTWGWDYCRNSAWTYCPGDYMSYLFQDILSHYPRDDIWMYLAVFDFCRYLVLNVAKQFIARMEHRIFSFLSVAFALVTAIGKLIKEISPGQRTGNHWQQPVRKSGYGTTKGT